MGRSWGYRRGHHDRMRRRATWLLTHWRQIDVRLGRGPVVIPARELGRLTNTRTVCSCFACRQPTRRPVTPWPDPLALAELVADADEEWE